MSEADQATVQLKDTSMSFVGRWNRLISTTNWEKGRIILQWRDTMMAAGADQSEYTDEAWAQRVGGVTGQHVGRLRRVFERFSKAQKQFEGLFWSHFQAALDWDDAEMWLEGVVQNRWSVADMRSARAETHGTVETTSTEEATSTMAEFDENLAAGFDTAVPSALNEESTEIHPADHNQSTPSDANVESLDMAEGTAKGASMIEAEASVDIVESARPFADLARLPDDVVEAFESFKIAILRHKTDTWQAISASDMLASLDALKELVVAPSGEGAV